MNRLPAESSACPRAPGESWLAKPPPTTDWIAGEKPPGEGWTRRKFALVLGFVLAFHLALIFLFGTKQPIVPRPVTNGPHLQLANRANEFITLGDPTLLARPNIHDLTTTFWRRMPPVAQPDFNWPAPPGYLPPMNASFGAAFHDFMQHRLPPEFALDFKPEPKAALPGVACVDPAPRTTLRIAGELARRPWLNPDALVPPSLPRNDVIAPSTVQLLVDTAGNVASAVVPEPNVSHDSAADQLALRLVRNLRFAPAPRLTFGEITFIWHTVPTNAVPLTNSNANP